MGRSVLKVLVANLVMTVLFAGLFAPASERFSSAFGLTGWSAVAPFVILPLYIGPAILALRPIGRWHVRRGARGFPVGASPRLLDDAARLSGGV
jgi:hypothetical protein